MLFLITGSSKGIGKALTEHFNNEGHGVITVGRSEGVTERGDLTDEKFRNGLVEKYEPDVFINNAGIAQEPFLDVLNVNGMVAVDLLQKFYQKMKKGNIINIGSLATTQNGYQVKDLSSASYILAKQLLHNASYFLQEMHSTEVKVTSLEIGAVATTIKNRFFGKKIAESEYTEQTLRSVPMKTADVVQAVDWIIKQPQHLEVRSLQINNFVKPSGKLK